MEFPMHGSKFFHSVTIIMRGISFIYADSENSDKGKKPHYGFIESNKEFLGQYMLVGAPMRGKCTIVIASNIVNLIIIILVQNGTKQ